MSRILHLALLAPDIVEAILAGRTDEGMMLDQLERSLPASWEEQQWALAGCAENCVCECPLKTARLELRRTCLRCRRPERGDAAPDRTRVGIDLPHLVCRRR